MELHRSFKPGFGIILDRIKDIKKILLPDLFELEEQYASIY